MLLATGGSAATLRHFDRSVQVWQATHNLVPGDAVRASDLTRVKVRIDSGTGAYLAGSTVPGGQVVRAVRAGELVPRSAVGTAGSVRERAIAVHVEPAQAATMVKGSVVDVWIALKTPGSVGTTDFQDPRRQVEAATVNRTPSAGGGFNVSQDDYVSVLVPQDKVAEIISAMNRGAKVTLVPTAGSPVRTGSS